jgi:3-hydroxyisobutyrate dehydrogenase-like beta-hydroxyacid dehydrogenase
VIGIMSAGDMGHAVGRVLRQRGWRVVTALAGRSAHTRSLAAAGGLEDVGALAALVAEAELILSIMPPAAAEGFAAAAAAAIAGAGRAPYFADCNAVAPATCRRIADTVETAGGRFIDVGIIGSPPGVGSAPTRFYARGVHARALLPLEGDGLAVKMIGAEIGRASGLKMCYAAITKGTIALHTAALVAAETLGLSDELGAELAASQAAALERMRASVPWLATTADRWVGEMLEIAGTLESAGTTPLLHRGAAEVFRLVASTPLAAETRASADRSRTLADTVRVFAEAARKRLP